MFIAVVLLLLLLAGTTERQFFGLVSSLSVLSALSVSGSLCARHVAHPSRGRPFTEYERLG